MSELTWEDEERAWLEARQSGIGATDAAAILGLTSRGSKLTVYAAKTEPVTVSRPSLQAWLGLELEAAVGKLYWARTGRGVRKQPREKIFRHPDRDWQFCHLDYKAAGRLVEIKTTAYEQGYGEGGTEQVPVPVWVQCQHEMAATDYSWCDVAVLIGNRRFDVFPIRRNEDFIGRMTEQEADLWFNHIIPRIPPEADGSDVTTRFLRQQQPTDEEPARAALAEELPLVERLRITETNRDQAKAAFEEVRNRLMQRIGSAGGLFGPGFAITYRQNRSSHPTDWALVATSYRNALEGIVAGKLKIEDLVDLDAIVSLYTIEKPGSRPFLINWKDQE
jgi:putative phage-type endonuclease